MKVHCFNLSTNFEPWGRGERWRSLCGLLVPLHALAGKIDQLTCITCERIARARIDEEQRELAAELATPIHEGGYAPRSPIRSMT
jgi:hypothetical protein